MSTIHSLLVKFGISFIRKYTCVVVYCTSDFQAVAVSPNSSSCSWNEYPVLSLGSVSFSYPSLTFLIVSRHSDF